jgi:hypothetical protein
VSGAGLYDALIGDATAVAPVVRALHFGSSLTHGTGRLEVRADHRRLGAIASRMAGLPPAGRPVPVQLVVVRTPTREVWVRVLPSA